MAGKYTGAWASRQMISDPERFTVHQPPHGTQAGFSKVELDAIAPPSELSGEINTDAIVGHGSPAYPIDRTPSMGGRDFDPTLKPPRLFGRAPIGRSHRNWTRGRSGGGGGNVQRTGYNTEDQRAPFGDDACAAVAPSQMAARGVDHGAGLFATKVFEPHGDHGQMHHEQRQTVRVEGFGTTPMANQGGGHDVLRRGLNADPINDGPAMGADNAPVRPMHGWREGAIDGSRWRPARYLHTPVQRRFAPTRQLPTDQVQINPARTPTMIVTTTVPSRSTKGGELFASLTKFLPKRVPVGGIARTPGPWWQAAEAQASEVDGLAGLSDYSGAVYA